MNSADPVSAVFLRHKQDRPIEHMWRRGTVGLSPQASFTEFTFQGKPVLVLQIAFWVLVFCPIYSMVLYPLLMQLLSRVYRRRFKREPITPKVTQIIAAYNEEQALARKLENSLSLDYPKDCLEIIVASDGSTDRTDEIARSFADHGVKLVRVEGGEGKSAVLNEAVRQATGEIVAFSDATGLWDRDSVRAMAAHYADPRVGCVYGWVSYDYDDSMAAKGFSTYQRFVMALRRAEAAFGTGVTAPGSIHSMRKSIYQPLPPAISADMIDPFRTICQGYYSTLEEKAISREQSRTTIKDEWQARRRICLRAWTFMVHALPRFPILRSPMYCLQLTSHKFLRWLVGPLMPIIFLLNLLLLDVHPIYPVMLGCQIAYYGLTLVGLLLNRLGIRVPGLSTLVFYNSVNFIYLCTLLAYARGDRVAHWRPSREEAAPQTS